MTQSAVEFLHRNGQNCVVSLGCGDYLNRIDNHVKLMLGCGLDHYVGIDRVSDIQFNPKDIFSDPGAMASFLSSSSIKTAEAFCSAIKVFVGTQVEDLKGIHCGVVVCQRVLPFRHWEQTIESMRPLLVLQEDLHGCELQVLSRKIYTRSRAGGKHYQLSAFRPWRILPGERNFILWRRRDHFTCRGDMESRWVKLYKKLLSRNTSVQ